MTLYVMEVYFLQIPPPGVPDDPRGRWKKKALHKGYAIGETIIIMRKYLS